jgi:chemotaxis protein histidine kinase CheA
MGGSRKEAELNLLAKVDEQIVKRSIQHLRDLQAAEQGVTTAAGRQEIAIDEVSDATQRNINAVRQNITLARQDNLNRQRAIKDLDQEAAKRREVATAADKQATSVARAARQSGTGAPRVGGGSDGTDFGRVGRGVSSVAAVLPGGAGNAARAIADVIGVLDDLPQALAEVKPALAGLTSSIGGLAAAGLAGIALAALAVAIQQFAKQVQEAQDRLDTAFEARLKTNELILTATQEEIDAQLQSLESRKQAIEVTLAEAQAARNAAEAGWSFEAALASLAEMLGITVTKSEKEAKEELEKLNAEIGALRTASSSAEVKARSAAKATDEQAASTQQATRAEQERTQATEQATNAIKEQGKQLAIFYENLVEHARASNLQAAKAERDLVMERQRIYEDFTQSISDQERQDARERAREARRAAYDKARAEIEGRDEAFELSLDRDFAGLARLRRQDERGVALGNLDEQFNTQEKLIATRERDQDNQLALQRQLTQLTERATQTRASQIQDEITFMRQIVEEFARIRGNMGDARYYTDEMVRKVYAMAVKLGFLESYRAPSNTAPVSRALGGPLAAGQWSTVNEMAGQRERFNGALLPSGKGLFYPLQSGVVSSGRAGNTINAGGIVVNVNGARDPQSTARAVRVEIDKYFQEVNR